mmetsp:Transcript_4743/g.5183  ORF Transcript_4743/g.5183 Transcript_4743/m.5183 type:complete len:141 (-) Transcript_4743:95-517(-)
MKPAATASKAVDQLAKTFTLPDLIKHATFPRKTILEMCAQYPSQGVGFKIWKKHWPKETYYEVKEAKFKDLRHGNLYGVLYKQGKRQNFRPLRIRDTLKRALWNYSVDNSQAKLDNGVVYTSDEMKTFKFSQPAKEEKEK